MLAKIVDVGVSIVEGRKELRNVGVSIGLQIYNVKVVDRLDSTSHCSVTPPEDMICPISFIVLCAGGNKEHRVWRAEIVFVGRC
jgi:hypothetical protein